MQVSPVQLIFEYVGGIQKIGADQIPVLSIRCPRFAIFSDVSLQHRISWCEGTIVLKCLGPDCQLECQVMSFETNHIPFV